MDKNVAPKISVIMSMYNSELYLRESIDSILNQTFTDFEFFIIDDASTDKSVSIVKSYADSRIKLIEKPVNTGLTDSLNMALELSKGKYIARLDSDDIAMPERFEKQFDYLEKHKDVAVTGTYYKIIDRDFVSDNLPVTADEVKLFALLYSPIAHPSALIRKEVMVNNGLKYDKDFELAAEDFDLWTRILDFGKIVNIPEVLLHYRVHGNQISETRRKRIDESVYKIRMRQLEKLITFPSSKYDKDWALEVLLMQSKDYSLNKLILVNEFLNDIWEANQLKKIYHNGLLKEKLHQVWNSHIQGIKEYSFKSISLLNDKYGFKQFSMTDQAKLFVKSIIHWKPKAR